MAVGVQEEMVSAWGGYWCASIPLPAVRLRGLLNGSGFRVWRAMLEEKDIAEQLPEVWEDIKDEHIWCAKLQRVRRCLLS